MTLAIVNSRAMLGVDAPLVNVETHLTNGLPSFTIVGMPETAVKESKDRVRSAIINSGFEFPTRRITVNLAPADLPKTGGRFDLPIAISILAASKQLPMDSISAVEFLGELALGGELRPIGGCIAAAIHASDAKHSLILPDQDAKDARICSSATIYGAQSLLQITAHLNNHQLLEPLPSLNLPANHTHELDLSDVKGQSDAKHALEIAAAGGHNLLMFGPPGTGKSMLASRFSTLLPPLSESDALATAAIHSLTDTNLSASTWRQAPFRSPHHTASAVALVGGGNHPKPGEISRAHNGVLFLDELPEFDRRVLEVLREPLETDEITVSRANYSATFPARFQLIAAMNPCACGYLGDTRRSCQCSPEQVRRYRARISGPMLDRIDLHVEVTTQLDELFDHQEEPTGWSSEEVRARILPARALQMRRQGTLNAKMSPKDIKKHCKISNEDNHLLKTAIDKLALSGRAYHRILKVARTIADLGGHSQIESNHLLHALSLRKLDRKPQ